MTTLIAEREIPLCSACSAPVRTEGIGVCWRCLPGELGITYRQLDFWTRRGWLRPKQDAPSSGANRKWPPEELEIARRMGQLTGAGIVPETAAVFARESWPRGEIAPGITLEVTP